MFLTSMYMVYTEARSRDNVHLDIKGYHCLYQVLSPKDASLSV